MRFKVVKLCLLGLLGGVLLGCPTAWAGSFALPLGLTWCQDRPSVEGMLTDPREAADGIVESAEKVWRIEGLVNAMFETGELVGLRVRFYETEAHTKKTRAALEKMLGSATEARSRLRWSAGEHGQVEMKIQSEQIHVNFEVKPGTCDSGPEAQRGLTDQEKADLEALKDKQAVEWDPYADVDDEEPIVKKKEKKEKKEEEEEEEKEALKDSDIDW